MRSLWTARLVLLVEAEWRKSVPSECETSVELWENIPWQCLELAAVNMVFVP